MAYTFVIKSLEPEQIRPDVYKLCFSTILTVIHCHLFVSV